jgi:hypothetical protein
MERAHANMSSATLTASYQLTGQGGEAAAKYEVRYRWPDEFRLRTFQAGSNRLIRDQIVETSRVVDFDPALAQYVVTKREKRGNTGELVAKLDENLDDLILAFTGGKAFGVWLDPLSSESPWSVNIKGSESVLTFKKAERKIVLRADWKTGRLIGADIVTGPQRLVWTLSYAPTMGRLAFAPPSGAVEFPHFDRAAKPPTYKDVSARTVAEKMYGAYSDLSALGFHVDRADGRTTVQVRGKFVRQEDDATIWTYDGKNLTLFEKYSGKWFHGAMDFVDVIDQVASHGTRVDPTLALVYRRYNPYRKRLGDGSTVKLVGGMEMSGQKVTILEAENEVSTITLFVRDKDGFVVGSSTRPKDFETADNSQVDLKYTYFQVPNDLAARSKLNVPQGKKPIALTVKRD